MKLNRKKVIWSIGILAVLLLLVVVGGSFVIDSIARQMLVKSVGGLSGREIEIGRVSLGFLKPRIRAWDVKIHNPSGYPAPVMVTLPYFEAVYDRAALKTNHLLLSLVRLDVDRIDIHETKDGEMNLTDWRTSMFNGEFGEQRTNALPSIAIPEGISAESIENARTNAPSAQPNPIVIKNMVYDGIGLLQVNLKECRFASEQFPGRNMERVCNLHEQYPNVVSAQDFQAIGVVLGMKTGVLFLLKDGKGAQHYTAPAGSTSRFK